MPRFQQKNSMSTVHSKGTHTFPQFRQHLHHFMTTGTSSVSTTSPMSGLITSLSTNVLNVAISFLQMLINMLNKFKPKTSSPTFQQTIQDDKVIIRPANVDETSTILQQTVQGDKVTVRPANVDDTSLVLDFILELADFEQMKDQVTATVESLQPKLFPQDPSLPHPCALILEVNDQPGK